MKCGRYAAKYLLRKIIFRNTILTWRIDLLDEAPRSLTVK